MHFDLTNLLFPIAVMGGLTLVIFLSSIQSKQAKLNRRLKQARRERDFYASELGIIGN